MRKLPLIALLVLACGREDALLNQGGMPLGQVNPDKWMDEPLTAEAENGTGVSVDQALVLSSSHRAECSEPGPGFSRCHARVRLNAAGGIYNAANPQGLGPTDFASAYNLPASGGSGLTVAIVDAQDDPNAESDLAVYRQKYGLPSCTTANGCFKKVNQNGQQGSYPQADPGWAGEIALDLDMVSAVCPSCNILLVEADSATTDDLGTAVNTAVQLGADAVSNSYGGGEDSTVSAAEAYYHHPGVFITASSGDNGYGVSYPASSAYVTAVGGTSLNPSSGARGWTETVWNGAGSGCSGRVAKPSWQTDTSCTKRMEADVSAVADPQTGVAVYCSYGGNGGWQVVGGTSAAAPIVASVFALTGQTQQDNSFSYLHPTAFYDVTSGSNGSCTHSYMCKGASGYDGPTGNGTPNGMAILGTGAAGGGGAGTGGGAGSTGGGGGSTGGGSGSTGGGSGSTGGGSGSTGGGSGSTGGGSGSTGGGSGATGGGAGSAGGGTGTTGSGGGAGTTGGGIGTTGGGTGTTGGGTGTTGGGTGSTGGGTGSTGGGAGGGGEGVGTGTGGIPVEHEPNDNRDQANPLPLNSSVLGSIEPDTIDVFTFTAPPQTVIDLHLAKLDGDCDVKLYTHHAYLIGISDYGESSDEDMMGAVRGGTYFVKVYGWAGASCSYELSLVTR